MLAVPLAQVKAQLSAVLDDVTRSHERVVVTRNGHPEAVILPVDGLTSIEETLGVLGTPGLPEQFDAAAAEIDAGDWVGQVSVLAFDGITRGCQHHRGDGRRHAPVPT